MSKSDGEVAMIARATGKLIQEEIPFTQGACVVRTTQSSTL